MRRPILACVALFGLSVRGQTVTVVNGAGNTVVQVISTVNGLPLTQVIQTLTGVTDPVQSPANTNTATTNTATTTTTTSAVPTITPTTVQQGPVGQPAATVAQPNGVTPYVYTTIVGGVTQVVSDNFTPTNPATVSPTIGSSGSVMDYSVWLSLYGPQTTSNAAVNSNAGERLRICCEYLVSVAVAIGVGVAML